MSSFLNRDSVNEVTEHQLGTITASALKVAVADGRNSRVTGKVTCPVVVEGKRYVLTFHIIPNLNTPVLFGIDSLKKMKCRLDFGRMVSYINTLPENDEMTEDDAK